LSRDTYEFERSDPPVWWEGNGLEYPVQKTLHDWMDRDFYLKKSAEVERMINQ
jgi:hypothetical protein